MNITPPSKPIRRVILSGECDDCGTKVSCDPREPSLGIEINEYSKYRLDYKLRCPVADCFGVIDLEPEYEKLPEAPKQCACDPCEEVFGVPTPTCPPITIPVSDVTEKVNI